MQIGNAKSLCLLTALLVLLSALLSLTPLQAKLNGAQLQRSVNTATRTLADHERRLQIYSRDAVTRWDWNRINSFKREIERLRTRLQILRELLSSKR